ncbi:MAG: sigma-70 family RNA polymerase sigma factor [Clostridia bacterium]|nr:sigma-70 family RNA polymerase sigma factor [Clostridia bacterium]
MNNDHCEGSMENKASSALCGAALRKIAAGDTDALSELYDVMGKKVFFTAYSVLGNYHDAEDAAQNTFVEIIKCARKYAGGDASAWVISVARNQALKLLRTRKSAAELEEAEHETEEKDMASAVTLLDALDRLSPEDKRIVTLHALCDLSFAEISAETGLKKDAAQKRYRRAIEKMKKYYGEK